MQAVEDGDLKPDMVTTIATKLGVEEREVVDMNRRLGGGGDASLNAPMAMDGDGQWQDWLVDDTASPEATYAASEETDQRHALLTNALSTLNDRERAIITARRLSEEPVTLEELATQYSISRERVRQIEVRAYEKLEAAVKAAAAT